jgi:hypothetical protein
MIYCNMSKIFIKKDIFNNFFYLLNEIDIF